MSVLYPIDWLRYSKMIVRDNTDAVYASYPLPPSYGVWRNYDGDLGLFPSGHVYADDAIEVIKTAVLLYEQGEGSWLLTLAQGVASFLVNSIVTMTTYTYPLTGFSQRWNYTTSWAKETADGSEYYMRTILNGAYAFLRVYEHDTNTYGGKTLAAWALELLDTGRKMQQFSHDRADGVDLPTWMDNSMSEWWNYTAANTTPQWSQHPLFLADVVWNAYTKAIALLGDSQSRRDTGTYLLSDVRDNYFTWLTGVLASHGGLMSDTNASYLSLPYQRMYCPADGTGVGHNWYTPASDDSATADWTSDAMWWTLDGLASGSVAAAGTYYDTAVALLHGSPLRFYDAYTTTGAQSTNPSNALEVTQASALAIDTGNTLSKDLSGLYDWLVDTQISVSPEDYMMNGAWTWTGDTYDSGQYLESVATAVILRTLQYAYTSVTLPTPAYALSIDPWWSWRLVRYNGGLFVIPNKSKQGWISDAETVSDTFRYTTGYTTELWAAVTSTWNAYKNESAATLKGYMNTALGTAGFLHPDGTALS